MDKSLSLLDGFGLDGHVPLDDPQIGENFTFQHVPLDTVNQHTLDYGPHFSSKQHDWMTEAFIQSLDDVMTAPMLPVLEHPEERKGNTATIQKFYEGRPTCKCCTNWVEKEPTKVPEEAKEKYDGVAIRLYHGKDHNKQTLGGLKATSPTTISIQSPIILETLEPMFKKIGKLDTMKGSVTLIPPFSELFFSHAGIMDAYSKCEPGSDEEQHIRVLKEVIDEVLQETTTAVSDLHAKSLIMHQFLWTLFPKGIIVVTVLFGQECLFEVISYDLATNRVYCRDVAFDGVNYGLRAQSFLLPTFAGAKSIRELVVFPLSFHESREDLEKNVIQRGRKVLRYQAMTHLEYVSRARRMQTGNNTINRDRIIIDPYAYNKFHSKVVLNPLTSENSKFGEEIRSHYLNGVHRVCRPNAQRIQKNTEIVSSRPQWLLLLDPHITGYSLSTYRFSEFFVDNIREVEWNDWAFERLVFSEDSKNMLLTLVQYHGVVKDIGRDIVKGKGNGFVALLSGPPGTGKTLTAEAIADQAKRPFLRIQAETLDEDDMQLDEAFELATEWDALLLIDEADAYLGSDSKEGERSSLVRTLMTRLEYYSGVLFLTTNFPEKIDEAFSSRIDVHFEYPTLDRTSRSKLLKGMTEFVTSSDGFVQAVDLTDEDYWSLARWELNGRELKNAIKVSSRICCIRKEALSYERLEMAIRHTAPRKFVEPVGSPTPNKRARLF